jgi:tetratricopeptide (TPR) repeat protein
VTEEASASQKAEGDYIAQADRGGTATVEVTQVTHIHPTPPPLPLQRPPRAQHFTNREKELAQLLADLQPGKVVTLCGPGGIGKTALAAEAVWQDEVTDRFPDGIIFHTFYGKPDPALALEHIARSFGEEPRPTSAEAALRALAGKQALLLLDGTEDADDLRAVLDVRGGCGAIVTSRQRKDAVEERQEVTPLEPDEAIKLLRAWGKDQVADTTVARRICELLGHLPLAVRLVGRYLTETRETVTGYLAWLEETPLEALDQGQRRQESVPVLLKRSLAQLSETACEALTVVGLLAMASFGTEVIAAALAVSENKLRRPLAELVNYGLLLREGERYEVSHALVHTYARRRMDVADEMAGRVVAYYIELAKTESAKGLEGYKRLDTERGHLMRVLAGCVEREDWEGARGLVWAVDNYLSIQGHWTERQTALRTGIRAALALNYRWDEEAFLNKMGLTCHNLGQVEKAIDYYEQALAICREIEDRQDEGDTLGNLGLAYRALGQVEKAIEYHEQALTIAREIGDRRGEGNHLGNLGNAYSDLGEVKQVIEYYEQALLIAREIGDRRGEGNRLGNLGAAYHSLGQVEKAIDYYQQALVISREIGDRRGKGVDFGNLGTAYRALGQVEKAIDYYEQALVIAREIGDRRGEAFRCWNLGLLYEETNPVRAVELMSVRVAYEREIGHPDAEAHAERVARIQASL